MHVCAPLPARLHGTTRRGVTRALLAATVLLGLSFVAPPVAAQTDTDGDGLFDADETGVYGTLPQFFDTDRDGIGDGEEVYLGTNPLSAETTWTVDDGDHSNDCFGPGLVPTGLCDANVTQSSAASSG